MDTKLPVTSMLLLRPILMSLSAMDIDGYRLLRKFVPESSIRELSHIPADKYYRFMEALALDLDDP
ncbi:MAG: hypothetical protein V7754_21355 [Halioglobus sp.]